MRAADLHVPPQARTKGLSRFGRACPVALAREGPRVCPRTLASADFPALYGPHVYFLASEVRGCAVRVLVVCLSRRMRITPVCPKAGAHGLCASCVAKMHRRVRA